MVQEMGGKEKSGWKTKKIDSEGWEEGKEYKWGEG